MKITNNKITNLVFKSGGVKGSAYAGSVQVLSERGIYKNITHVGGASAGAITAALLATGSGSQGLIESVKHTDFRNFISDSWGAVGDAQRLFRYYGLHTGDSFDGILKKYFKRFCGNAEITFYELEKLAKHNPEQFKHLSIVAYNITSNKSDVFNAKNTPELQIWHAVRASMSIPIIFEPQQINGSWYIDGGISCKYPIDLFDEILINPNNNRITRVRNNATLGFFLEDTIDYLYDKDHGNQSKIDSLESFTTSLVSFIYYKSTMRNIKSTDRDRTVFINDLGIRATDFSITDKQVDQLIISGRNATESCLELVSATESSLEYINVNKP